MGGVPQRRRGTALLLVLATLCLGAEAGAKVQRLWLSANTTLQQQLATLGENGGATFYWGDASQADELEVVGDPVDMSPFTLEPLAFARVRTTDVVLRLAAGEHTVNHTRITSTVDECLCWRTSLPPGTHTNGERCVCQMPPAIPNQRFLGF